jgi:hypothetical protein
LSKRRFLFDRLERASVLKGAVLPKERASVLKGAVLPKERASVLKGAVLPKERASVLKGAVLPKERAGVPSAQASSSALPWSRRRAVLPKKGVN